MASSQRILIVAVGKSPVEKAFKPHIKGIALPIKSATSGPTCTPLLLNHHNNHKLSATPSTSVSRGDRSAEGSRYRSKTKKKPSSHGIRRNTSRRRIKQPLKC